MILPSMSFKEMHDCLVTDSKKVQIRIDKIRPKVIKYFKKSVSFPKWYIDEYRIPSTNNQWVVFYYVRNVGEIEKPSYTSFCIMFSDNQRYVISDLMMGYQHTPKCDTIMLPHVLVYTSHFFQRYNERFLHKENLSANEIAGLYLIRNPNVMPIKLNEKINKNFKEHGEHNHQGMRVNDGFCFTKTILEGKKSEDDIYEHDRVDAMLVLYNTYMNENDMTDTQRTAINKGHIETLKHCFDDLLK